MPPEEKRLFKKELIGLTIPLALQALLQALVGATDALMLGRLTQDAVAAVSLANQIPFILSLFTGAVISAAGVLMAQYIGKNDRENTGIFFVMAIRTVFLLSLGFSAAAFFVPEKLMSFFTEEPELIRIGAGYLRIAAISFLFSGISQCYLMVMQLQGRVKLSLIISCVTVAVDMGADFFLIYGFGKLPALGADGSACSTVLVEFLSFLWVITDSRRGDHLRPAANRLFYFSRRLEKAFLPVAAGLLASSLSWGLSMSAHSFIMGHMGTEAVAASSITGVAQQLIRCIVNGTAAASGIILGKLLGADELEKAKRCGDRFFRVSFFCGLISVGLLAIAGPLIVAFFVLEPLTKSYLIQMLLFSALYEFACSYNTIFTVGVFPAGGDSRYDAISVFIATWCLALPVTALGCFVLDWPVMTVYIVMSLDEIVKVPFIRLRYNKNIWLQNLTR